MIEDRQASDQAVQPRNGTLALGSTRQTSANDLDTGRHKAEAQSRSGFLAADACGYTQYLHHLTYSVSAAKPLRREAQRAPHVGVPLKGIALAFQIVLVNHMSVHDKIRTSKINDLQGKNPRGFKWDSAQLFMPGFLRPISPANDKWMN